MDEKVGDIVWPPPILWQYLVEKRDLLIRLRRIIANLKGNISHSNFLGQDTDELEYQVAQTEDQLAKLIDDYMAADFARSLRLRKDRRRP